MLFLLAGCIAGAQTTDASISGLISDQQGAAVPGATVIAISAATGVRTVAQSNGTGFYSLRPLPIGAYTLTVEMQGFHRHTRENITLTTGLALQLDVSLEIGALAESVTVTERPTLLETRSAEASQLVESKTIEDMPLGDRRSMNLIEITGAAVFVNYDSGSKPNFSLAGGRTQSQMFLIDGGSGQNMRLGIGQMDIDPPVETLQEVKILSNGFSAEFGGSAGGVVIANTKSGTNQYRGSLFEYLRNQVLDAPHYFAPIVDGRKDKPSLRYNVFGGVIGGPIRRDKTFFFFAYEGSRRRDGSVRTLTVQTALQRAGDFSQTFNARGNAIIYDPFTGRRPEGSTQVVRDPFPGNVIPPSRIDPVAANIVPFYPLPNREPDDRTGANNFRANDINALTRNNITVKVDQNLGSNDKFTVRYLYNSDISKRNSVFPIPDADPTNQNDYHQQYWYGTWTRIVGPNIINEFRTTYGRRLAHTFSRGFGGNWPSKLGLTGVSDDAFPNVAPAQYAALGSTSQERRQFPIQQYHLVNGTSWISGKHTVKFGGELRPSLNYEIFRPTASGRYVFDRGLTGAVGNAQTGNGFATMLLGVPGTFEARETDVLNRRTWYGAAYLQDDWMVSRSLTLNVGLRWEIDTPLHDVNGYWNGFDMDRINPVSGTPGVVRFGGRDGFRSSPYDADLNNFGPRFGFAWRPLGLERTVLRGGYGVFFAHPFDRAVANAASLGFERSTQLNLQANSLNIPYRIGTGLPIPAFDRPVLDDRYGSVAAGAAATHSITFFETDRRTGYSQQFSLRVQQELPDGTVIEIGYLGNVSRKLASSNLQLNQIVPERMGPGTGQKDRPFPQFSGVAVLAPTIGVSTYNAGVLKAEKRFSRGFNMLATYTWAKFLDNADAGGGGTLGEEGNAFSNLYNRRMDWGPSENDIRHRLTWSSVYQLPFGKGRPFLKKHPLRHLAGGWSVGSVMLLQSGPPITVQTQTNTTYAYSAGPQRADVLRNPNLPASERTVARWFDTEAFAQPEPYTFGNQGVGVLRGDGVINLNGSLIRSFNIAERKTLHFRAEMFNAANHPNFGLPGRVFEGAGFGVISSARAARQVQFGLRLTY